eukprot:5170916-Pyramimonas_sp.AAC.1
MNITTRRRGSLPRRRSSISDETRLHLAAPQFQRPACDYCDCADTLRAPRGLTRTMGTQHH